MNPRQLTGIALALIVTHPCTQAEVVHLKDGGSLVGAIVSSGSSLTVGVRTVDGVTEVDRDRVLLIETRTKLLRSLNQLQRGLDERDWRARLAGARFAAQRGLFDEALRCADEALRAAPPELRDEVLPAELLAVPVLEVDRSGPLSDAQAMKLLGAVADERRPATARVATARLLALATEHDVADALLAGARDETSAVRRAAITALGVARPAEGLSPVLRGALLDDSAEVRAAAVEALRQYDDPAVADVLIRALDYPDARLRAAAMDATLGLNETLAVAALVRNLKRGPLAGPPSSYVSVTEQQTFISDFDVDVANSAFIANPNVGVVQSGTVLQTTPLATTRSPVGRAERRRIVQVLGRLTGEDFGDDADAWESWLTYRQDN